MNALLLLSLAPFAIPESEIAGTYYYGDGLGVNCVLELKADHRFDFQWRGCLGVYGKNLGSWKLKDDTVVLQREREGGDNDFDDVNVRFLPIVWGKRQFLVDEYQVPGFCSGLPSHDFIGPRFGGSDYVKMTAKHEPVVIDRPNFVPERFRGFVQKPDIEAVVSEIRPDGTVVLNKGTDAGLRAGLRLSGKDWTSGSVDILSAKKDRSVARPVYFAYCDTPVKKGERFGTWGAEGTGAKVFAVPPRKHQ